VSSVWDDPSMRVSDNFVKFEKPGDTVTGIVQLVRPHRFDDGSVAPQITLLCDDGEERTLTGGAIRLKAALAEQRPDVGNRLTVTLASEEKRSGGKTLRHWDVVVDRYPQGAATPAAPAATPAAPAIPAELTEEQKAALRAAGIQVPA